MYDPDHDGRRLGGTGGTAGNVAHHGTPGKHTLLEQYRVDHGTAATAFGHERPAGAATDVPRTVGAVAGQARHDFGVLGSMLALERLLATYIRTIAPQPGDAVELSVEASVCIEGLFAELTLEGKVEHGEHGFTLSGETTTAFGVGEETSEATAELGVHKKKGLELVGRSPETCVEEIGLYMDAWLRERQWTKESFRDPHKWLQLAESVYTADAAGLATLVAGEAIADLIFGRGFQKLVLSHMDVGDHVESSRGIGVDATLAFGSEEEGAEVAWSGGYGVEERTTYTKGRDGELETEREVGATVDLAFELTILAAHVKFTGGVFLPIGRPPEVTVGLTIEADTSGTADVLGLLIAAFTMAKLTFASKLALARLDEQVDTGPVVAALFGSTAHTMIETAALSSNAFDHVGVKLTSSGGEVVASMFSRGAAEAKTGVVNVETEVVKLHELGRWPLPPAVRWDHPEGEAIR